MDKGGGAARWADQSVLRLLRGLSHRQALPLQPFPVAICLCPLSFPILAPFFFSLLFISSSSSSSIAHFGLIVLFDLPFYFPVSLLFPPPQCSRFSFFQVFPLANKWRLTLEEKKRKINLCTVLFNAVQTGVRAVCLLVI